MKIIINENQFEIFYPGLKKIWDKQERPLFNPDLYVYFGLKPGQSEEILSRMFQDYLGGNEIEERVEKLISDYSTWSDNIQCNGFDFKFALGHYEIDYDDQLIYVNIRIYKDGTVINPEGETLSLDDALFDEFGHEYRYELENCVLGIIANKFLSETGLDIYVEIEI